MRGDNFDINPHPLVTALIADPDNVPNLLVLTGYIGQGATGDRLRVYTSWEFEFYFEIPFEHVLHVERIPENGSGELRSDVVWVSADAPIVRTTTDRELAHDGPKQNVGLRPIVLNEVRYQPRFQPVSTLRTSPNDPDGWGNPGRRNPKWPPPK